MYKRVSTCVYAYAHTHEQDASSQRANKVHFGIRHPWFLKPRAVVPLPFSVAPLWISLVELTLSLPCGKTLSTSPPPACPRSFLDLPHRLHYLYPNSQSFSLFLRLAPSVRSLLRLCFSFPRAAPACLPVFLLSSFPSPPPLPSFLTVGSRPRPFVPYRPRSPPSSPTSVLRTRTPLQKTQVQYGRNGGFLPSLPFTLFPSFLYLSLNLSSSLFLRFCSRFSLLSSSSSVSLSSRLIVLYLCLGCSFPSLLLRLASTCT